MRLRAIVKNIVNSPLGPVGLEIRRKPDPPMQATAPKPAQTAPVPPPPAKRSPSVRQQPKPSEADWDHHAAKLNRFSGIHKRKRCFIIGNGPSLNQMDLAPLRSEVTFGLNRFYLLHEQLGFETTYHVVVNRLVIEQCVADLKQLSCTQFISWLAGRDLLEPQPNLLFIHTTGEAKFALDIRQIMWEGSTVTYVAMQLAYYMGFTDVILIGVDHRFATQGPRNLEVVSDGNDPNHFDPNYFGKGFRWQLPDLETSEMAYLLAKWRFERSGRRILDATVGGALEVFPKIKYEDVIKQNTRS